MVPIQEIEIHADRNAKIIVHIEFHEEQEKFSSKAVILDRKVDPGPLGNVHFGDDHGTAHEALRSVLRARRHPAKVRAPRERDKRRSIGPGGGGNTDS